tara:strand:- start:661 stop:894 length:234 start_codon:yes stop_codon:yes gene_type:complete
MAKKIKRFGNPLLSFAAPLLIILAITGFFHRDGSEKIRLLPAFFVGAGLIVTSALRRYKRRRFLLLEIRDMQENINF